METAAKKRREALSTPSKPVKSETTPNPTPKPEKPVRAPASFNPAANGSSPVGAHSKSDPKPVSGAAPFQSRKALGDAKMQSMYRVLHSRLMQVATQAPAVSASASVSTEAALSVLTPKLLLDTFTPDQMICLLQANGLCLRVSKMPKAEARAQVLANVRSLLTQPNISDAFSCSSLRFAKTNVWQCRRECPKQRHQSEQPANLRCRQTQSG